MRFYVVEIVKAKTTESLIDKVQVKIRITIY